jgi:hypothetical protein
VNDEEQRPRPEADPRPSLATAKGRYGNEKRQYDGKCSVRGKQKMKLAIDPYLKPAAGEDPKQRGQNREQHEHKPGIPAQRSHGRTVLTRRLAGATFCPGTRRDPLRPYRRADESADERRKDAM